MPNLSTHSSNPTQRPLLWIRFRQRLWQGPQSLIQQLMGLRTSRAATPPMSTRIGRLHDDTRLFWKEELDFDEDSDDQEQQATQDETTAMDVDEPASAQDDQTL